MKKHLALFMAVFMLLTLCACGDSDEAKELCGIYELYAMEEDGTAILADDMVKEGLMEAGTQIALNEGGKGVLTLDGDDSIGWKYDGAGTVTITAGSDTMQAPYKDGIITLDIEGVKMYFASKDADTSWIGAKPLAEAFGFDEFFDEMDDFSEKTDFDESTDDIEAVAAETEIQQMWNGWWYGGLDLSGCTGNWEWINNTTYDAMMYVELNENGVGTMELYDLGQIISADLPECFAVLECHADTSYLYGDSGTSFDVDINPSDWIVVHNGDNFDKINVGSSFTTENGSKVGYDLTLMKWGSYWEGEENYTCFIPNFDAYIESIEDGQIDPFGNYADEGSAGGGDSGANTSSGGGKSALLGSNPAKLSLTSGDVVFVYYPADKFEYDTDYGMLKSNDGSVSIMFVPMLGSTNLEELKASYEEINSKEDDYSLTETTVNGYKAIVMTYTDWLDSTMRVDVDFGASHDGIYGMSFSVKGDSLDDCDTELIWAIIESFELAK